MLILADQQLTGEILGKPFHGKTLPPAAGGAPPAGLYQLQLPDKDPVFGAFVLAVRPGPGAASGAWYKKSTQAFGAFKMAVSSESAAKQSAGADTFIKRQAGSSRMVEWKMPGGTAAFPKMQPPGDSAQFPKMQPPGGSAGFPKMQPPGGTAGFPKMQPPGGTAEFPKMQPARGGTAGFPKMQPPMQQVDGAPAALVLSQRAIPGRYCLVVVSGFADLLAGLQAAGGSQLVIR